MTENLHNNVFDSGLNYLDSNVDMITILNHTPTPFNLTQCANSLGHTTAGYVVGRKTGYAPGSVADRTGGGRELTFPAISTPNNDVVATGTATHWAAVDTGTAVLAWGQLSAQQSVTKGNTFTLTSFTIGIPDPA